MLTNLNELTPYERALLRQVEMIYRQQQAEVGVAESQVELRIPAPPPPGYSH